MSMNGFVGWDEITSGKKNSGEQVPYLYLKSGGTYKVRPVHQPVHVFKFFNRVDSKDLRTAVCADPDTCEFAKAHPEIKASERYAILVIDRDDGQLKIMEGPKTIFLFFKQWYQATGESPGGKNGVDWQIKVTGSGLNTQYSVINLGKETPFTQQEKERIRSVLKDENGEDTGFLEKIYKPHTPEEIEQRLFGDKENKESNVKTGSSVNADEFGDIDKSSTVNEDDDDINW